MHPVQRTSPTGVNVLLDLESCPTMSSSLVQYPFKSARLATGCTLACLSWETGDTTKTVVSLTVAKKAKPLKFCVLGGQASTVVQ